MQILSDDALPQDDTKPPYVVRIEDLEAKLLNTGLLFAINRLVLHPAGLALALVYTDEGKLQGLELMQTHNNEAWKFDPALEAECIEKLKRYGADRLLEFINNDTVGISLTGKKEESP